MWYEDILYTIRYFVIQLIFCLGERERELTFETWSQLRKNEMNKLTLRYVAMQSFFPELHAAIHQLRGAGTAT